MNLLCIVHSYEQLNKKETMNNIKKIGLTALAGSLVMVSANAIEYTMSGGLISTYSTQSDSGVGGIANNGKGLGTATDLAFNASGELDNGFTVDYFMSIDTDKALSNTSSFMTVGMGSLGTIRVNNDAGSQANAIDDITPHAYNETWDGLSVTNISFFGNQTTEGSIDYRIPAQEYMGTTINASVTYDPSSGNAAPAKAGVTAASGGTGTAYTLQLAHESGLEIGGGIEQLSSNHVSIATSKIQDENRNTAYIKYAIGGLTAAYQESYQDSLASTAGTATEGADLEASYLGVAYTAGNVTVSYAEGELETKAVSNTVALATEEQKSTQIAYTMGAMTLSAAISTADNVAGTAARKYEENTLAVSFAF